MNKMQNIISIIVDLIIIGILIFSLISFGNELSLTLKLLIIVAISSAIIMIIYNTIEIKNRSGDDE